MFPQEMPTATPTASRIQPMMPDVCLKVKSSAASWPVRQLLSIGPTPAGLLTRRSDTGAPTDPWFVGRGRRWPPWHDAVASPPVLRVLKSLKSRQWLPSLSPNPSATQSPSINGLFSLSRQQDTLHDRAPPSITTDTIDDCSNTDLSPENPRHPPWPTEQYLTRSARARLP